MDTNRSVQLLFRDSHSDCDCVSLHHFSCIRTSIVKTDHFIVLLQHYCFGIDKSFVVRSIFIIFLENALLQRIIFNVINRDVLFTELAMGLLFTQTTTTVLQRSKDSCGIVLQTNILLMMLKLSQTNLLCNASAQMPSHLGSSTCQFRQTLNYISQSIDIISFSSLNLIFKCFYFLALMSSYSYFLQIECVSCSCSSYCKQYSIKFFWLAQLLRYLVLHYNLQFSSLILFYTHWQRSWHDIYFLLMHIRHDVVNHISVKRTQILSSSHQAHVVAHPFKKTSNLDCYVSSSNDQSFTWWLFFIEDIIACNSMLCTLNLQIGRPRTSSNHKIFSLDLVVQRILRILLGQLPCFHKFLYEISIFGADNGIFILEGGQTIQIIHVINFIDVGYVAEVDGFDIGLYFIAQLAPIESSSQVIFILPLIYTQLPTIVVCVYQLFMVFGSLMHQLFGNAAYIHASTSQAPFCFVQTLLHEVYHYHVQTMFVSLESSGKAA